MNLIGVFKVPNKSAYRSNKAKLKFNGEFINRLHQFFDVEYSMPTFRTSISEIKFPQFLSFIGETLVLDEPMDVLIIGNPIYIDQRENSFSMIDGYFPSDAHILTTEIDSVFGTKGKERLLSNISIHFAYQGVNWNNELHRHMVHRFWSLYTEHQNGKLVSFISDLDSTISRMNKENLSPSRNFTINKDDTKLEMISIQRNIEKTRFEAIFSDGVVSAQQKPDSFFGKVLIGIIWDCLKCDLDLYAQPYDGGQTLYYQNRQSPEGRYYKDWLDSPTPKNGLEFIEFTQKVDLSQLKLAVNFFSGKIPAGVKGELRLEFKGLVYSKPFHIEAKHGNGGQGKKNNGMGDNKHWVSIRPIDIINDR
ncbi:MAG: hypothetical protein O6939_09510 [Bacteroidetes bacterium]|nr:hypothetical protein [Bacteroidota bacterium]